MQYVSLCAAVHPTLTAGMCPWCGHAIIHGRDQGISTDIRSRDVHAVMVARFLASLQDPNPRARLQMATFLGQKGAGGGEFLPDLTRLLQDPDRSVREAVAQAIKSIEKRK